MTPWLTVSPVAKSSYYCLEGEDFRTVVLDYADGPRYLVLVRDESKPDLLAEILKPATGRPNGVEPGTSRGETSRPGRDRNRAECRTKASEKLE